MTGIGASVLGIQFFVIVILVVMVVVVITVISYALFSTLDHLTSILCCIKEMPNLM